jgi:hypothetical protein
VVARSRPSTESQQQVVLLAANGEPELGEPSQDGQLGRVQIKDAVRPGRCTDSSTPSPSFTWSRDG